MFQHRKVGGWDCRINNHATHVLHRLLCAGNLSHKGTRYLELFERSPVFLHCFKLLGKPPVQPLVLVLIQDDLHYCTERSLYDYASFVPESIYSKTCSGQTTGAASILLKLISAIQYYLRFLSHPTLTLSQLSSKETLSKIVIASSCS